MALGVMLLGGCSRSTMNYQLSEAIGTLGMYEDNEPVETPKMQMLREQAEAESESEAALNAKLDEAAALAGGYYYQEAIDYLESLEGEEANDDRVFEAIDEYESLLNSLTVYTGDIPHLCFPQLIEDPTRAFDGDDRSATYQSTMITYQ